MQINDINNRLIPYDILNAELTEYIVLMHSKQSLSFLNLTSL